MAVEPGAQTAPRLGIAALDAENSAFQFENNDRGDEEACRIMGNGAAEGRVSL